MSSRSKKKLQVRTIWLFITIITESSVEDDGEDVRTDGRTERERAAETAVALAVFLPYSLSPRCFLGGSITVVFREQLLQIRHAFYAESRAETNKATRWQADRQTDRPTDRLTNR